MKENHSVAVPARATRATPRAAARLGHTASIANAPPFNSLAAYERERTYSRTIETLLAKALDLLTMENDRRKRRGEDVAHLDTFVTEARKVWS